MVGVHNCVMIGTIDELSSTRSPSPALQGQVIFNISLPEQKSVALIDFISQTHNKTAPVSAIESSFPNIVISASIGKLESIKSRSLLWRELKPLFPFNLRSLNDVTDLGVQMHRSSPDAQKKLRVWREEELSRSVSQVFDRMFLMPSQ